MDKIQRSFLGAHFLNTMFNKMYPLRPSRTFLLEGRLAIIYRLTTIRT